MLSPTYEALARSDRCPAVIFHKMVGYAVKFTSACLNADVDGTIYFGTADGKDADEDQFHEKQPPSDATYEEGQEEEASSEEEGAESGTEDSEAGSEADDEERASEASGLCDASGTDCDECSASASEAESE